MDELEALRAEITAIDDEMAALFVRRMTVSSGIAAYKEAHGLPVYDPVREKENLDRAKERVPAELQELYRAFLQENMDLSKQYQQMLRGE